MTTTIKSSALDFNNIKNNLKVYFESQPEFADYNFEASGLSNILDVLAYNTHINALSANLALNESFLGTAQLRASLVSLSEATGYIPGSRTSSRGITNLYLDLAGVAGRPSQIFLAAGQKFTSNVDGVTYVFQTLDALQSIDDGSGTYVFQTADGSEEISVYEGDIRVKNFYVGSEGDNIVYVIPDKKLDIETVSIKVYDSPSSDQFRAYTNFRDAINVDDTTYYFILRESPNEFFDLSFGNGSSLGNQPIAGQKIECTYLSTTGPAANGALIFVPTSDVEIEGLGTYPLQVTTVNKSFAGSDKEDAESIRYNAPYVYAAQNRMVTAVDYASITLERFPNLITDIVAWGGEDNIEPEFGVSFLSILFNDDVTDEEEATVKSDITDVAEQLSVMSFGLRFADPQVTYIETGVTFDFNPSLTTLTLNAIQTQVRNAVKDYFTTSVGRFGESFRRSNLLSAVDDVSPAVLSSSTTVAMQRRIQPILSFQNNFEIRFPAPIIIPDDVFYRVTSSSFTYNNKTSIIRNKLKSNTLQIINIEDNEVLIDNIGSYDASAGKLFLVGFAPQSISGGVDFIKISAVPANASAVTPFNNDVLFYDEDGSFVSGSDTFSS